MARTTKPIPNSATNDPAVTGKSRPSLRPLRELAPYAFAHRGMIFAAMLALLGASGATLAVPFAISRVIDVGFSPENIDLINATFIGLLAVVAVLALSSACRYYFVTTLGEYVVADLRRDLFAHLVTQDAAYFDTAKIGELLSRLTVDTTQLKAAFGSSASVALRNFFLFIGAVVMMVMTSPKLSALVLIAIPIIVLPLVFSGRSVRQKARVAQDAMAEATAFASENLSAIRQMQAYGAGPATVARFTKAVQDVFLTAARAIRSRSMLTGIAIFLAFGSVVAVLWFGAHDVISGAMKAGLLSQFVLYAVLAASSLGELSQVWSEVMAAAGAAGRISEILAVKPAIHAPTKPLTLPRPVRGELRFEHVQFAYPSRHDDAALRGIDLQITPGETVAIVGPSGAGKSTLLQLLLRFYDPDAGSIRLDGVDLRELDPVDLRAQISLVPQEPVIFGVSIADNIAYGYAHAQRDDIIKAGKQAAADGFIQALPQGYDTLVGERGMTLSGGQRQRLAIARAILRHTPVLVLDEATSALDAENETLVQGALDALMGQHTTLVVAHRLATVLRANRIIVLDEGRVVETGNHQQLVDQNGLYARLARLQFDTGVPAAK